MGSIKEENYLKKKKKEKKEKKPAGSGSGGFGLGVQATSRKGCMKGKGGPLNASCTYKGVRQRTWGKWVSEIREPNHGARVWLGTFDTSTQAAVAYDQAARKLYGPDAKVNLPVKDDDDLLIHSANNSPPPPQLPIINHQYQLQNQISSSSGSTNSSSSSSSSSGAGSSSTGILWENMDLLDFQFPDMINVDEDDGGGRFVDVALPEFDDSALWEEAKATIDLHVLANQLWNFWGDEFQYPWYY